VASRAAQPSSKEAIRRYLDEHGGGTDATAKQLFVTFGIDRRAAILGAGRAALAGALAVTVLVVAGGCGGAGDDDGSKPPTSAQTASVPEEPPKLAAARVESALIKELDGMKQLSIPLQGAPGATLGGGRLEVKSLSCPNDVPVEKGGTFSCKFTGRESGGSQGTVRVKGGTVRVTQLDSVGERFRYKAKWAGAGSTTTVGPVTIRLKRAAAEK
jgi:uncharacterized protein DUF4333